MSDVTSLTVSIPHTNSTFSANPVTVRDKIIALEKKLGKLVEKLAGTDDPQMRLAIELQIKLVQFEINQLMDSESKKNVTAGATDSTQENPTSTSQTVSSIVTTLGNSVDIHT